MVMTDPIADMLTRIRNANMAFKEEVVVPGSRLKERIAEILVREGYVQDSSVEGEGKDRRIVLRTNVAVESGGASPADAARNPVSPPAAGGWGMRIAPRQPRQKIASSDPIRPPASTKGR